MPARTPRLAASLLLLALCALERRAAAQAPPATAAPMRVPIGLRWRAPAECPSRAQVLAAVTGLLGRTPDTPADHLLIVNGEVAQTADEQHWRVEIQVATTDGIGARTLVADNCEQLAGAAALVIALTIDPNAGTERAQVAPASTRHAAVPAPSHPSPPPRGVLGVFVGGDVGTVVAPSLGLGLAGGVLAGPMRVELAASWWMPRSAPAQAPGAEATLQLLASGVARACVPVWRGRVEVGPCVAFEADALRGSASGAAVTNATTQQGFRLGALAGAGLWWNVARALALRAQAEVGATLASTRFTVNGCGTDCDFAPAPLVGRLTLGAELRFP